MKPIQMLLLAGAGYLVYSSLSGGSLFGGTTPAVGSNAPPPPSTGTGPQNPAAQPAGHTTPTGNNACSMTPVPDDMTLMRAAINPAWIGPAGNYCQNAWQWNYWREQYQARVGGMPERAQQTAFDDITDPKTNITAAEYHALLARKGLSGLRYAPILPYGGWSRMTH